jgi:hypothetical protein
MMTRPEGKLSGRFRWRVIPAAFLMIFGGVLVLAGVLKVGVAVFIALHPAAPPGEAIRSVGQSASLFGGVLWLAAGRWCLQGDGGGRCSPQ